MERWDAFDSAHPAPTFFARPAFARALAAAFPNVRAEPFWIEDDGATTCIPLVQARNRLGLRVATTFPLGAYGCVLDERGEALEGDRAAHALRRASRAFDRFTFVAWPLAQAPDALGVDTRLSVAAVIDCMADAQRTLAAMPGRARRTAATARRRGVVCERARADDHDLSRYYAMLEETSARFGLRAPTISRRLLDAVFAFGKDDAELWFARVDGESVAGGVVLFGRDELFFWSAAMRREFSAYRPSNALNARLLERACERGMRWYNLGASDGSPGSAQFKQSLGARAVPYRTFDFQNAKFRLYAALRGARHADRSA